jgi:hypothetical protein
VQAFKSKIFSGMGTKRNRTMEDEDITQELFLNSNSDPHTSENKLESHDSGSEGDQDKTPTIHRFTGGPSKIK